eukprot:6208849-Pleurochrysis_carterae.AAC.2
MGLQSCAASVSARLSEPDNPSFIFGGLSLLATFPSLESGMAGAMQINADWSWDVGCASPPTKSCD